MMNNSEILIPVLELISRKTPYLISYIELKYLNDSKEYYELSSENSKIIIKASSLSCFGLAYSRYLFDYLHKSITWTDLELSETPKEIPLNFKEIIFEQRHFKYSYYLNPCTFSYSMVWWTWERWEKEIDLMFMKGINIALAFTGQEAIFLETMKEDFNLNEEFIINKFFTGPAFLAWQRMGNLRKWASPLTKNWIKEQLNLGKKIVKRMRELGIKTILPLFNGFVPKEMKLKFKDSSICRAEIWAGFLKKYTANYFLNPNDSLYKKILSAYIKRLINHFGTDHYYLSDQFNEMDPETRDSNYLSNVGKSMIEGLKEIDEKAIWVMQGWLFYYSMFWNKESIKNYLSLIPNDQMIILDLVCEETAIYKETDGFFGKGFIWCVLHNYGGNNGIYGNVHTILKEPIKASNEYCNMLGIGITMEGINQNMIVYDLTLYNAFNIDINIYDENFLRKYIWARYSINNEDAFNAWKIILKELYIIDDNKIRNELKISIFDKRPKINLKKIISFKTSFMIDILNNLIKAGESLKFNKNYLFDLVDFTRQFLVNLFKMYYYNEFLPEIIKKNNKIENISNFMLEIILDIDLICGTNENFLFGKWLLNALKWSQTSKEQNLYRFNAKNQITAWGRNSQINDYASKHWNGLIKNYYYKRWEIFFNCIISDNLNDFEKIVLNFEDEWNIDNNDFYSDSICGDCLIIADNILKKYKEKYLGQDIKY